VAKKKSESLFTNEIRYDVELEKDFQERVMEMAGYLGWRCYAIPDSRRASLAGYPDLTCWSTRQKRIIWIELKREKGRISPAQEMIHEELRSIGLEVYVFRPSQWTELESVLKGKK